MAVSFPLMTAMLDRRLGTSKRDYPHLSALQVNPRPLGNPVNPTFSGFASQVNGSDICWSRINKAFGRC